MAVLGLPDQLEHYRSRRNEVKARVQHLPVPRADLSIDPGQPRTYAVDAKTDNRSAWGNALEDLGRKNAGREGASPIVVFDCDLAESVKTGGFHQACPERFYQSGIQEHHTAAMAGALSTQGVLTFWSDFGVFGVDEVYNQQRLNDINHSNLKTVCTHSGLDVGEDGKTHQCIDYIGLARNIFGYRVVVPADPNETDRAVRWAAVNEGNVLITMGRSKLPVITLEDGSPAFAGDFHFEYGKATTLRLGHEGVIISTGTMTHRAVQAADRLRAEGIGAGVVHVATPLALDMDALRKAAATGLVMTYEDHHVGSGLGSLVAEALLDLGLMPRMVKLGVTRYQPSGTADDVFAAAGLDVGSLVTRFRSEALSRRGGQSA
jgi:transketolase